jgi:hypothetical protein
VISFTTLQSGRTRRSPDVLRVFSQTATWSRRSWGTFIRAMEALRAGPDLRFVECVVNANNTAIVVSPQVPVASAWFVIGYELPKNEGLAP